MNRNEFENHIKELAQQKITFDDVKKYWDAQVESEEKQWGKDYIYSEWKREAREQAFKDFKEGKPVLVYHEYDHFGYGTWGEDVTARIYSDGTYTFEYHSAD